MKNFFRNMKWKTSIIVVMFLVGLVMIGNAKPMFAQTVYRTGANEDDLNDLRLHKVDVTVGNDLDRAEVYPSAVDLSESKYFPAIGNQGNRGSCVAFATTYYQFTYEANRLNNISSNSLSTCYSPAWTYNYMNGGMDAGMYNTDAYKLLKERGALRWSEFPYTDDDASSRWPKNTQAMINALKTRVSEYYDFQIDTESNPIANIRSSNLYMLKKELSRGKCLVISCQTDGYMSNMMIGDTTDGERVIYRCSDCGSGHAMAIVGYDDSIAIDVNRDGKIEAAERGAFKLANSWGSAWGNDGYIWVLYDALNAKSQISGDWESGLNTKRRAIFARNTQGSRGCNIFYYIDVENKNVDVVSKLEFTAEYKRNFEVHLTKEKAGHPYAVRPIFARSEINIKDEGSNDVMVFDNSCFNYDQEEVLGNNTWKLFVEQASISNIKLTNTKFNELKYTLVDEKNNLIRAHEPISICPPGTSFSINTNMVRGSVDYDASVSTADAQMVQKYALKTVTPSYLQAYLADYNQDGKVNMTDAQLVLKKALKIS